MGEWEKEYFCMQKKKSRILCKHQTIKIIQQKTIYTKGNKCMTIVMSTITKRVITTVMDIITTIMFPQEKWGKYT